MLKVFYVIFHKLQQPKIKQKKRKTRRRREPEKGNTVKMFKFLLSDHFSVSAKNMYLLFTSNHPKKMIILLHFYYTKHKDFHQPTTKKIKEFLSFLIDLFNFLKDNTHTQKTTKIKKIRL